MDSLLEKIKKNWDFISVLFLWLCIWATYDTDISRVLAPGFPHNALDLFHGLRVFLPFVALILAAVMLFRVKKFRKTFFLTPLGLLGIFTIVGIIASLFSSDPFASVYWGALYGSVIVVLLAVSLSADWLFVAPLLAYIQCLDSQLRITAEPKGKVLDFEGIKINAIKMPEALDIISGWIKSKSKKAHFIVATGMHGIVEALRHADFKYIISHADLFVPDGISLVWLLQMKGFDIKKRVSGADLIQDFFKLAEKENFTSYFYGDTEDTLAELKKKMLEKYPKLKIAGNYSPPFRELTEKENDEIIEKINRAKPDVLWVGLGLPKQERWIFKNLEKLDVPAVIGVGAAFKFLSGKVKRAPKFIGDAGFEWLWRLAKEPKVIWKRVFIDGPFFFKAVFKNYFYSRFNRLSFRFDRSFAKRILLFAERYFLWPAESFCGEKLLKELTPYDVKGFEDKIRLGNMYDGGYVIPENLLPVIEVEYCYGVDYYMDFEEDLIKRIDVPVRFYDHTVDGLPAKNKNFFFKKQGIAEKKYGSFDTFRNHMENNGDSGKKILLKIDIEGGEWKIMEDIINESSENIVAIVLEIHRLYRYEKIAKYIKTLRKINSRFTLVHLHGNNNGETVYLSGNMVPSVLELTFINNNLVKDKKIMASTLPSEKDYPNVRGKEDMILDFWKK